MSDDFESAIVSACRTLIGTFGGALKDRRNFRRIRLVTVA